MIKDGDAITIDAETKAINVNVTEAEMELRQKSWTAPPFKATNGTLFKFIKNVSDASHGCVTDA